MKHRLLLSVATLTLGTAGWVASAQACEDQKTTKATAASVHATCTAEMAAKCTPAQAAACKTKGAKATAASVEGGRRVAKSEQYGGCSHAKNTAATVANKSIDAAAAVYRGEGFDAYAAGSGGSCSGRGFTAAIEKYSHGGCDACADMSLCDEELKSASSVAQVVKLKNGVMFVHTASSPSGVRAVQAAMTRRNDRLNAIAASGDRAKLCPDCKAMRGAIASGKLTREMVAIEGGCLTLMTSNDPNMVSRLHALAGVQTSARIKS
jgi:hypothetical protein